MGTVINADIDRIEVETHKRSAKAAQTQEPIEVKIKK